MSALVTAIGALRRVNRLLHYASGAVLLAILAITVTNIFGRRFGRPLEASVEMTGVLMGVMVFLALAFGEDERVHITVDLLYERVGPSFQRTLRLVGRAFAIVLTALMVWRLWEHAESLERSGLTTTVREWPIHPFVRVAAGGAFMLLLSTIANFLADLLNIEGYAEEASDDPDLESAI